MAHGDYAALVDRVRRGAPVWNPMAHAKVDELTNLIEYFVHHEDVRRAQPGWEPRELSPQLQGKPVVGAARSARLMFRKAGDGHRPHRRRPGPARREAARRARHRRAARHRPPSWCSTPTAARSVARVEFQGDADDIAALQEAELGIS